MDRRAQLRDLFGIEFPDELFEFWDWYRALSDEMKQTFIEHGGMSPHGVCDVLDGKFDGVKLRYPAVLHWRFRLDPPEFITVLTGDTDGLHWGFWFDDPQQPPVIAGNYARDAYEFWVAGNSLFEMIEGQIDKAIEGCEENLVHDKNYEAEYRQQIAALNELATLVPSSKVKREKRTPTHATDEGMGIVVPRPSWDGVLAAEDLDSDDALETCIGWIDQGKAGAALFRAKQMWAEDHDLACKIMERAYRALGRDALAAIAKAHGDTPGYPRSTSSTTRWATSPASPRRVLRRWRSRSSRSGARN